MQLLPLGGRGFDLLLGLLLRRSLWCGGDSSCFVQASPIVASSAPALRSSCYWTFIWGQFPGTSGQTGGVSQTFVAEPDVETVTLQLAGLELTVSARRLSTAPQSEIEFEVIPGSERPRPSSAPVFPELSENRQEQVLAARTARELAALDLPFLGHLVGRLRGSQGSWTPSARIARAFAAGLAAKKRLEGIVHPHAAPGTPCRNSIYIALRAPFRPEGFWTPNYPTYIRLVEPRDRTDRSDFDSGSVSHAFATRAEADAYLLGAARAWPPAL